MVPLAGMSSLNRKADLEKAGREQFDVLVIGGGIMGAGIALDAASRNLKVLLLEKQDFAAGTSSRSTKLIHGGLRYLKNLEFGLVATVARERKILQAIAPHLVTPEPMLLPVLQNTSLPAWVIGFGLHLYELLGQVSGRERHRMLSKNQTLAQEPLLNPEKLTGSGLFTEYRTDDARLTLEVIKTARLHGATCLNYLAFSEFQYDKNQRLTGVEAINQLTGETLKIAARCMINATGPWSGATMQKDQLQTEPLLFHTKGVHLVVPHQRLPIKQSVYFDIPGGRMLFCIPRGEITYLGTTDTPYKSQLENPEVTLEDATYLLNSVNQVFPTVQLGLKDVVSSWSGIRPLLYQKGKKPTDISRKDEVFVSDSGLISVAGGKLTGYRHFAAVVVNKAVSLHFPENQQKSNTRNIRLLAGNFENPAAVKTFREKLLALEEYKIFPPEKINYLVSTYGLMAEAILENALALNNQKNPENNLLKAEINYTIKTESALTISDFLIRRSGRLYFERDKIAAILPTVMAIFKENLQLSEEVINQQLQEFNQHYKAAISFKPEVI